MAHVVDDDGNRARADEALEIRHLRDVYEQLQMPIDLRDTAGEPGKIV